MIDCEERSDEAIQHTKSVVQLSHLVKLGGKKDWIATLRLAMTKDVGFSETP